MSAADSLGLSHARIMAHGYCDCIKLLVGSCASPLDQGAQGTCAVHSVAQIHEPRIASMCHLPAKGRRHVAQPPTALRSLYRPNALWACMIAKQSKAKCVSCRIGISFEFIAAAASADSYPRQAAMPWRNWKRRRRLTMPWQGWKQQLPQACPRYSQKTTHVRRNYAVSRDCYTAHLSEDQKRAIVESHARIVAHGYCDCIKLLVGRAKPLSRLIEEGGHGYCDCIKLLVGAAASPIACARGSQRSQRSAVECLCKFRAQPRVGCGRIAASMRRCVAWQSPRGGSEGVILARLMGAHLMGWFHKAHVRTDSVEPEALRLGIHREPDWWAGRGSAAQLQQVRRGYLVMIWASP